jgi:hypothetical protein
LCANILVSSFQDKARKATGMQIDATEEGYGDPDLFSINAIKVSCCFHSPIFLSLLGTLWKLKHSRSQNFSSVIIIS